MLSPSAPGELELDHVYKSFDSRPVLKDVSLVLASGTVAGVIGANGSGKTTLLRIFAGTVTPDSGRVSVGGARVGKGRAALVPVGERALYWRLTAGQELEFFAKVVGNTSSDVRSLIAEASTALALDEVLGRQIGSLSTGQRRRVMVARSLLGRAPVLLMDEPFADLDAEGRQTVGRVATEWAASNGVVVWTSPTPDDGPYPSELLTLDGGQLTRA